jgi:hypothetical protein
MRHDLPQAVFMLRGNALLAALAIVIACDNVDPSDSQQPRNAEPTLTQADQIAELRRKGRLIMEEMKSVEGPNLRARVERRGSAALAAFPSDTTQDDGFYTVEARLLTDGAVVTVYIPNRVSLPGGTDIDVVSGREGHYFRSIAVRE